jgi:hypothetical protein
MGILFKTYQKKHQLHVYNEVWQASGKEQLEEVMKMFPPEEMAKAKIKPFGDKIDIELNGLIVDCKDMADLKDKFGLLAELKEKYQKIFPAGSKIKKNDHKPSKKPTRRR